MGTLLYWTGRGLTVLLILMAIGTVGLAFQGNWSGALGGLVAAVVLVVLMRGLAAFAEWAGYA